MRKVLGRLSLPLVHPSPKERDGYVPNVVLQLRRDGPRPDAAALRRGGRVHDLAHVGLDDLLGAME
ncbi:hypothetical protein AB5I41_23140 [Sphingomonas sp. MMS24-JH45]